MALTKEDLSAIKTIVDTSVGEKFDELALRVGEGFNEVTRKFEKVDGQFEKIDKRFDRVERRLDRIETDIREVKWDLADTVRRIHGTSRQGD